MLKNYYKINENIEISNFLRNLKDKKNANYIILEGEEYYIDIRTIALRIHNLNEKLKSFKKPLSKIESNDEKEILIHLIESGERVIKTNNGLYDFIDGLKYLLNNPKEFQFLNETLNYTEREEIYAINFEDKISQARNLFIQNRINLLPVINEKKEILGELRPIDLMVGKLYETKSNKNDYFDENYQISKLNLPIKSLINIKPITLDISNSYKDAISKMIEKKLSSLIITKENKLFTIISYKDIFKLVRKDLFKKEYNLEITGTTEIYDDDLDLIYDYTDKIMKKIMKISEYNSLKISFKTHGNVIGTHKKKFEINFILSKGNKIIHVDKEILTGTNEELSNNKIKTNWNTPALVQDGLKLLLKKVIQEKSK